MLSDQEPIEAANVFVYCTTSCNAIHLTDSPAVASLSIPLRPPFKARARCSCRPLAESIGRKKNLLLTVGCATVPASYQYSDGSFNVNSRLEPSRPFVLPCRQLLVGLHARSHRRRRRHRWRSSSLPRNRRSSSPAVTASGLRVPGPAPPSASPAAAVALRALDRPLCH